MEIHHHKRSKKKKKAYKEYLFEFLVIFVAIIGSYLAENIREHYVEKRKESQLIMRLYQDLTTDTIGIRKTILTNDLQIKGLDSLQEVLRGHLQGEMLRKFYFLDFKYTSNYNDFISNTSTLSLIMKTGGLSLIKDQTVAAEIADYDLILNGINKQTELIESRYSRVIDYKAKIIDFSKFINFSKESIVSSLQHIKSIPPLNIDKQLKNTYYFEIIAFKGTLIGYNKRLEDLLKRNIRLNQLIKNKYL